MNAIVKSFLKRLLVPALLLGAMMAAPAVVSAQPATQAQAPAAHGGGEANLVLPDLSTVDFNGISGPTLLMGGIGVCILGLLFGLMTFTQLKNLPVHALDARGVRADLRDVQDLSHHAGQVHPDPRALHRRDHGVLLRRPAADGGRPRRRDPALQPDRHRGQLRRRVVRHPGQHVRQLARGVCQPAGQAVPDLCDSAALRHEHRHAAHQRRAVAHAQHSALHAA